MKRILNILFLFGTLSAMSQSKSDQAKLTVKYQYSVVQDTMNTSNVFNESMILIVGQNASLFKSYDILLSDSIISTAGLNALNNLSKRGRINDEILHYYQPDKEDLISKLLITKLYYEKKLPIYNWKITKDTLTILGYKCNRATSFSTLHNKVFNAWFTTDLPFPAGPNSFYGLPGLILKVESQDKFYKSEAFAISKPTLLTQTVALNPEAVKTTFAEYQKVESAVKKNPELLLQGLRGSFGKPIIK